MIIKTKIIAKIEDIPVSPFEDLKLIFLPPKLIDILASEHCPSYSWEWTDIIAEMESEYRRRFQQH